MMEERDPIYEEVRERFTIKELQERVWRLEAENKELKQNNYILDSQLASQRETQADILKTLHAQLDENNTKIEKLELDNRDLETNLDTQVEDHKKILDQEKQSWESRVSELTMRNEALSAELREITEFRKEKEAIEGELNSLRQQLKDQEDSHLQELANLGRKKAVEIDNLKKDMQREIRKTREDLRLKTKDQLDTTTKRTIMENEQMATELHFQSKETEKLLERNKTLTDENSQLRRNLFIHKELENELARRTHLYQKLIKKMHSRSQVDTTVSDGGDDLAELSTARSLPGASQSIEASHGQSRSLEFNSSDAPKIAQLSTENEKLQSTLSMVRFEFAQYRRDHSTLTQLQDQSTRLVIAALYDLKNQTESSAFPPADYDESAPSKFAQLTSRQREYFFQTLLETLNSSICPTCCPPCDSPGRQQGSVCLPQISKQSNRRIVGEASHGKNLSTFLRSIADGGDGDDAFVDRPMCLDMGTQTETISSDPCYKEGLWNPQSRSLHSEPSKVTPAMVAGPVRSWGQRAMTHRSARPSPRCI